MRHYIRGDKGQKNAVVTVMKSLREINATALIWLFPAILIFYRMERKMKKKMDVGSPLTDQAVSDCRPLSGLDAGMLKWVTRKDYASFRDRSLFHIRDRE